MKNDPVIDGLMKCGLSEKEAQLFYTLNQLGPCNASTLVRETGILRIEAYRILKKLEEKKLVKFSKDRPAKFKAIPVEKAIFDVIEDKKSRIRRMHQIRDELKKFFVNGVPASPVAPRFNIIQGRPQILSTAAKIHSRSKKEICIMVPKTMIVRDVSKGIDDILEQCRENGVCQKIYAVQRSETLPAESNGTDNNKR